MLNVLSSTLALLLSLAIIYQIYKEQKLWNEINKKLNKKSKTYPLVSVIVPIKGLDIGIHRHIQSLLNQDYPNYEVIYVVDSTEDPVINILKEYPVKVILSNYDCQHCSGKVKAQISGLLIAKGDVIIFADSDTIYPKNWVRNLTNLLDEYEATTVFSWPLPYKLTIKNLLRAGFWTLGFESQAVGGTFLWGGSMALKRSFFEDRIIKEFSKEICDDCALTRLVKERNGKIGFVWQAMPINLFDENNLLKWASREVLMIIKYSKRGAKVFIAFVSLIIINLIFSLIYNNFILGVLPLILWVFKNILRGRLYSTYSILPAIFSIPAIFFGYILLIMNWNKKEIEWRGRKYILN